MVSAIEGVIGDIINGTSAHLSPDATSGFLVDGALGNDTTLSEVVGNDSGAFAHSSAFASSNNMLLLQICTVALTYGISCAGGWLFSNYYFARAYKNDARAALILFCGVFGVCCNTIVLVLFELLDLTSFRFRLAALQLHVLLLVCSMLFALPCFQSVEFFRSYTNARTALWVAVSLQLVMVYLFLSLGPRWPGMAAAEEGSVFSIKVAVMRTGMLGICIMAILSGFGTVDFPYTVMRAFIVPVNQFEIHALQTNVEQIRDQISQMTKRLSMLEDMKRQQSSSHLAEERSWLGGMMSVLAPQNREAEQIKSLQQDIKSFSTMEATLAADLADLRAEKAREMAASTLWGQILNLLGYALSAYCVLKMLTCLKSVLFGEDFTTDPVSRLVSVAVLLCSGGNVHIDIKSASQYITLVFIGFVSFNSLRAFLKHMQRCYASIESLFGSISSSSRSSAAVASCHMLILGGLLCAYTISSVIMLRAQLPVSHREIVTLALGFREAETNIEFGAIHRWFNGLQLVSLLVSLLLCYWQFSSKKANAMEMHAYGPMPSAYSSIV